jgi:hypothetical protein
MFQIVRQFTIGLTHPIVARSAAQVSSHADEDKALARHFVCP